MKYSVAVVALAFAVASCSTTSTPLVVDALTLTDQAGTQSAALNSSASSETSQEQVAMTTTAGDENTSSQDHLVASKGTRLAYAGENSVSAKDSETASAKVADSGTQAQATASSGSAGRGERLQADEQTDKSAQTEDTPARKSGFFASLFGTRSSKTNLASAYASTDNELVPARESLPSTGPKESDSAQPTEPPGIRSASAGAYDGLPGVRQQNLFDIAHRNSIEEIDTIDAEERDLPVQVASAAGMARMSPEGFVRQRDDVDISCLRPSLVNVLKKVERHYGEHVVITSGYRSREHNRRVHGAKNSLHMYCAAADIKVPGINKWELAKFLRSMPGRGGVGTYCHTNSVHVDVGRERDWNWRCRRGRS